METHKHFQHGRKIVLLTIYTLAGNLYYEIYGKEIKTYTYYTDKGHMVWSDESTCMIPVKKGVPTQLHVAFNDGEKVCFDL